MKLKELIEKITNSSDFLEKSKFKSLKSLNQVIYGEELYPYLEEIKNCEEFINCDELHILKTPITLDGNGNSIISKNYKLVDEQSFKGKCYLLSLSLTPEMYDPKKIMEPVMDDAVLTPAIYNPLNFEPKKKIIIEFNPEMLQDQSLYLIGSPSMIEDAEKEVKNNLRKKLHETLDKILDNPENYHPKVDKSVMVRGMFEIIDTPKTSEKNELFKLETEKQVVSQVFFFENDEESFKSSGNLTMKLSSMIIPHELKDKFVEELGHKSIHVTREEINEFLNKYKTI